MDLGFTGATAVVTGGSKGMGLAIAETLGAEGASVAIMDVARPPDGPVRITGLRHRGCGRPVIVEVSVLNRHDVRALKLVFVLGIVVEADYAAAVANPFERRRRL